MRIQFIFPNLACGGAANDARALEVILRQGITHAINLTTRCDEMLYRNSDLKDKYDLEVLHLHFPDDRKPKPFSIWHTLVEYASTVLSSSGNKLFVHCAAGNARSPSVCYAIVRAFYGYSEKGAELVILKHYRELLWLRDSDFPKDRDVHYKSDIERYLKWRWRDIPDTEEEDTGGFQFGKDREELEEHPI